MDNREIDALIAEKVFNLPIQRVQKAWTDEDWMMSDNPTELNCMAIVNLNWKPGDIAPPARCIFDYSTDISAAWLVYEWLEKRGIVRVSNGDGDSKDCDFLPNGFQGIASAHISAGSYPLAICLAALEAVGVEIK